MREPMRFYLLIILCFLAIGCNSDPNCRRETALLRSEILDLEDKYYLLKSERDTLLQGQPAAVNQVFAPNLAPIAPTVAPSQPVFNQPGQILQQPNPYQNLLLDQLGHQPIHDQTYGQGIAYADGQAHYVDTGEPYFGEPTYSSSHETPYYSEAPYYSDYNDPDIIYEDEIGYHDQVINAGQPTYAGQPAYAEQTTLARSSGRLAPDDSILPLYSSSHAETVELEAPGSIEPLYSSSQSDNSEFEVHAEDFDLETPLLDEDLDSHPSVLHDEESDYEELDLLLEAPGQLELELGQDANVEQTHEVAEVVINSHATRGHDIDGLPGDEGLDLLIQPRSADGQVLLSTGELTVSVLDPTQPAEKQRIGLWKFIDSETELFFANNELGSYGILLHLPWDQQTPVNRDLTVHVRFVPPTGEAFETTTQVQIEPPQPNYSPDDPLITGWTRSDRRWDTEQDSLSSKNPSNVSVSEWIRRKTAPKRSQVQAPPVELRVPIERRRIQALPAKATINRPAWRPTR